MSLLNVFALSGFANGVVILGLGIFIIFHNWRDKLNRLYFLIVIALSIWSFSYWKWLSSGDAVSALFWVRMLSIGSTLIPVFYFHWIVYLLGLEKKQRNAVKLTYFLASFFLIFSFSNLFVSGVEQKLFFPFWPNPGILYNFYLVFLYIFSIIYSSSLLFKSYRIAKGEDKKRLAYVLTGAVVAFSGGLSNFFLWYNIPIVPYGNFLVAFYPVLFGYATIKYRLFNVRVITTELFTIAIWIFLLIKVLISVSFNDLVVNLLLFIAVFIFGVLLIRSIIKEFKQREKIEKMAEDIKKAYETEKKAKEELQRLDEVKTQFTMATQHHLRTPLTSMRGYIDLIMGGTYGEIPEKLKDPLKKFEISTKRLIKIVNEFLDMSQFQLGKEVVTLSPGVKLEPIIKEIIEELKYEVDSKKLYLILENPDNVHEIKADEEKLKVALFNLIDNAAKYTQKGGVRITVLDVGKIEIRIRDTGIGIAKEEIPKLFGRTFERGKEAKKVFTTGRGIGLYITGEIIKAHNGRIWVESDGLGMGSTFHVELPAG